jgi:hypothetical protein
MHEDPDRRMIRWIRFRPPARLTLYPFIFFLVLVFPNLLHAHGISEARYSPPIPGWLFLVGGGLAVALSFVFVNLTPSPKERSGYARWRIPFGPKLRVLGYVLSAAGLFLAGLILAGGFIGDPRSEDSLASVLVWGGWWMGLTWLTLLIGNLWAALDPWSSMRRLYGRFFNESLSLNIPYPAVLASWPAVLLLMGFIWFELAWFQAQEARGVVNYFLIFTAWLWVGMIVFKPGQWWENANPFSRYFQTLGRFGPAEKRGAHVEVRIPGTALHATQFTHLSESIFVIVVLFAVTFDGFVATPEWWVLLRALMLKSFAILPRSLGFPVSFLFAIFAGVVLFAGAYLLVCAVMSRVSGRDMGPVAIAGNFAMTLVPIAAAYHIAHFIPAVPGRLTRLVQVSADPFGLDWHLFGAQSFSWKIEWTPEIAGGIWVVQTGLIVLGHIVSIWSAHRKALSLVEGKSKAIKLELPMAILMIAYTVISLWIISRPVLNEPLVPLPGITP